MLHPSRATRRLLFVSILHPHFLNCIEKLLGLLQGLRIEAFAHQQPLPLLLQSRKLILIQYLLHEQILALSADLALCDVVQINLQIFRLDLILALELAQVLVSRIR